MSRKSVLQPWVADLPLMMQGTLMTSVRGNDILSAPKLKPVTRWLRYLLLVSGNAENDFMDVTSLPAVEDFEDELEYVTLHYFLHLVHSLEIVGYKHPDQSVREIAFDYYHRLCDWLHMFPEPEDELDERLSGKPGTTGSTRRWARGYRSKGEPSQVRIIERVIERLVEKPPEQNTRLPFLHRHHGNSRS